MKIKFLGEIYAIEQDEDGENEKEVDDLKQLNKLDGRTHDSALSEYIHDGEDSEKFDGVEIGGGTLSLKLQGDSLVLNIEYSVEGDPSEDQILALWEYTQVQLLDGAGPIFAGDCEDETGLCPVYESEDFKVEIE